MPPIKHLAVKLLRKKPVQSSTHASLAASGAVPDSGFAFVHNSQGASAALDEFSGAISAALEYIDLKDGSEGGPFKTQLKILEDATADYSNSTTDTCCELIDWDCDSSTAELTNAAFKCAAAAYKADPIAADALDLDPLPTGLTGISGNPGMHRNPETTGVKFTELEYIYPSLGGSSKAIGFWIAESEVSVSQNSNFPALIVAVRGTEKFVDHIVNANSRPTAAAGFLGLRDHKFLDAFVDELSAHSGFLTSAKNLSPPIVRHISNLVEDGRIKHVAFTGHSAGGGVAALLYLKFLLDTDPLYETLKFSCFTFGAPPILGADITETIRLGSSMRPSPGFNFAFVNEFDMVSRADHSYVRSLIDLLRSVYGLGPSMNDEIVRQEEKPGTPDTEDTQFVLPSLDFSNVGPKTAFNPADDRPWTLPIPDYHTFGDLVLLRKEHNTRVVTKQRSSKELRALSIRAQDFEKLLYCGIKIHSRIHYTDRMESVLEGKFNYKGEWKH